MRMQLFRAKSRTESQDIELAMDMMIVFSKNDERKADDAIFERLAKKLELHTMSELRTETMAVIKLLKNRNLHNAASIQQTVDLLGKFKQIAGIEETSVLDGTESSKCLQKSQSFQIPHEFLCPITLEIMTDPVIVATGQVILKLNGLTNIGVSCRNIVNLENADYEISSFFCLNLLAAVLL